MTISYKNRTKVTTTTTGTGALTQGAAVTGFQAPAAGDDGKTYTVCIEAVNAAGAPTGQWEVCESVYTHSGTSWSRGTLYDSSTGSRIDFAAGTKRITVDLAAESVLSIDSMTATWNAGGTTFTGLGLNITDSASAAGSKLFDFQLGSTTLLKLIKDGTLMFGPSDGSHYGIVPGSGGLAVVNGTGSPADAIVSGLKFISISPSLGLTDVYGYMRISADATYGLSIGAGAPLRFADGGYTANQVGFVPMTGVSVLRVTDGTTGGGALQFTEMTAPAAPAANNVRLYAVDNGAGKTQLMALFGSGAAQQVAIEP